MISAPSLNDYRGIGKGMGLLAYVLFVAWWYYPLLIVIYTCIYSWKILVWLGEEANYLGAAIRRG